MLGDEPVMRAFSSSAHLGLITRQEDLRVHIRLPSPLQPGCPPRSGRGDVVSDPFDGCVS